MTALHPQLHLAACERCRRARCEMEQELADVDVERHSEECNAYEAFETDDEAVSGKPRKKGPGMWRRCLRLLPALGLLSALGAGLVISGPFLKDWFSQLSQESSDQLTTTVATQLAGDGRTFPREGDLMVAHITGKLANGTEFFSSRAAGAPLHFTLHVGEVSLGLMIGLRKMSLGERSHVRVPKVLNYRGGWRTKEPAREDVEFDVQILVINGKPWDRLNVTAVETPGDGKHFPALGDTVYVAFECLLPDSTVADSTARLATTLIGGQEPRKTLHRGQMSGTMAVLPVWPRRAEAQRRVGMSGGVSFSFSGLYLTWGQSWKICIEQRQEGVVASRGKLASFLRPS